MENINRRKISFIAVSVIVIIGLIFTIMLFVSVNNRTVHRGVSVKGIDIGGLNQIEAIEKLKDNHEDKLNGSVLVLKYGNYVYKARYLDLDMNYDYYKAVEQAYKIGRRGNLFSRFKSITDTKIHGKNINLELVYNGKKIDRLIENIKRDLVEESHNAQIELKQGTFKITPEIIGKKIEVGVFRERIIQGLSKSKVVEIPVEKDVPKITKKSLEKIKYAISEFSTAFGGSSAARKTNIQIAGLAINGSVVMPGETFSFNKATGVRNQRAGYMISKVIVDGEFVDDIGGGVCQVSTTLYNTAVRSGLEIVERHHHSIPVGYVPKGEDAAVSYDYLDLKIKNNYDFPIYIQGISNSYAITFKIYGGKVKENRYIDIESVLEEKVKPKVEKIIDRTLAPGTRVIIQKGRYGYKVKAYKVIYEDGKVVEKKLISEDFYKPRKYIFRVGPARKKTSSIQSDNSRARLVQ